MRCSLWPGLLDALRGNLNRQHERARLFEAGHVFLGRGREVHRLAAAITGPALPTQWGAPAREVDFFDVKGDLQALLAATGAAAEFVFQPAAHPALHPGRVEKQRKSFALRLTFQSDCGNLTAAQVDAQMARIVAALQRRLGAKLRD